MENLNYSIIADNIKSAKIKTVVFIHGFRKEATSWNITSTGKLIQIQENIAKNSNTVLIQMTEEDYMLSVTHVVERIKKLLDSRNDIILVTHSIGSLYAVKLAELYPDIFKKLLLIDPTIKTPKYHAYLMNENRLVHYDDLPEGLNLPAKVIVRIHFDYNLESTYNIPYYNKMTNKNVKSRLILHNNIGHMIHWKIPHVIIDSINEMIRL